MSHLRDHELAALVFENPGGQAWVLRRNHLGSCQECRERYDRVVDVLGYVDSKPAIAAPSSVWVALAPAVRRSKRMDWSEPRWLPLILAQLGALAALLAAILTLGAWLAEAGVWKSIQDWPLAHVIGPHGVAAVTVFLSGALVAVGMAPAWWWELRRPERRRLQRL